LQTKACRQRDGWKESGRKRYKHAKRQAGSQKTFQEASGQEEMNAKMHSDSEKNIYRDYEPW